MPQSQEACKAKAREYWRAKYAQNPELYRERARRWRQDNPERAEQFERA